MKGTLEGFPLMLVGNKCDDETKREVNKKTGEALQVSNKNIILKWWKKQKAQTRFSIQNWHFSENF